MGERGVVESRDMYAPACCLALKALSSSSSSAAGFFLGFLLWMGFVPAAYGQLLFFDVFDAAERLCVYVCTDLPFLKASWRCFFGCLGLLLICEVAIILLEAWIWFRAVRWGPRAWPEVRGEE